VITSTFVIEDSGNDILYSSKLDSSFFLRLKANTAMQITDAVQGGGHRRFSKGSAVLEKKGRQKSCQLTS
jgi:hypothetical protein